MTARIIDGKEVAAKVHEEVAAGVTEYREQYG
ncbi:MAG TPA: bifunctional methylenetetrahydrofolate dehydrogenase/methenyltetrahydrofolate cyclohydrolase, partial [Dehalococcoidia bacterium]|nr:bifunctional methylenetetrahydrofolate dehydrogenase/methenyltetrahydrofolate cyclohydrolase [Dehalococcoidia bacterium]